MAAKTAPIDFSNPAELMHQERRISVDTQAKFDATFHACAMATIIAGGSFDNDALEDLKARVRQGLTHEQCLEHATDDAKERFGKGAGQGKDRQA